LSPFTCILPNLFVLAGLLSTKVVYSMKISHFSSGYSCWSLLVYEAVYFPIRIPATQKNTV